MTTTTTLTREQQLELIYKHTHPDFRGIAGERWGDGRIGKKTIVVYRNGTCLVLLEDLTDAEIADRLPSSLRKENGERTARAARATAQWNALMREEGAA